MRDDKFAYDFECKTPTDYTLDMTLIAEGELFNKVLNLSKIALKRKHNLNIVGHSTDIKEFEVDKKFYHVIKIAIGKLIKNVEKQLREDKIKLLTFNTEKCTFRWSEEKAFEKGHWNIIIQIGGIYADQ